MELRVGLGVGLGLEGRRRDAESVQEGGGAGPWRRLGRQAPRRKQQLAASSLTLPAKGHGQWRDGGWAEHRDPIEIPHGRELSCAKLDRFPPRLAHSFPGTGEG